MSEITVSCVPLGAETLPDYLHFFDHRAFTDNPRWAGCYCYFPLHDPQTMVWKERGAAQNRQAVAGCVASGEARGWLAYHEGEVVGWCNAGPAALYPMLADEPLPQRETLGVIMCFVVAPAARGQGVARQLLEAACQGLRDQGMTAVGARPIRDAEGAAANHLGPLAMYLQAGFHVVSEDADGDVLVMKAL
jgi:GNAT superfamily N-acetyltransferase